MEGTDMYSGGPPPIRIQPPASDTYVAYTSAQLAALNRGGRPYAGPNDVQYLRLMPNFVSEPT
jgi:hypothetical protein